MAFSPFAMPFIGTLPDVQDIFRKPGDSYVPSEGDIVPPADNHTARKHANESCIAGDNADIYVEERQVSLVSQRTAGDLDADTVQSLLADSPGSTALAPNPTYQWAVVVGDYAHQLQTTSLQGGDNYYRNTAYEEGQDGLAVFPIGTTKFNDVALSQAGAQVIASMDETYNFALCNGQIFAMKFLNRILKSGRSREFVMLHDSPSSQAVPKVDSSGTASEQDTGVAEEEEPGAIDKRRKALLRALLMMDQNTPALADALIEAQPGPLGS